MYKNKQYLLKIGPPEYKIGKYHSSSTQPQPKNGGFKMGQLCLDLENLRKTWKSSLEAHFAGQLWCHRATYQKSNATLRSLTKQRFWKVPWTIRLKPNLNLQNLVQWMRSVQLAATKCLLRLISLNRAIVFVAYFLSMLSRTSVK